MNNAVTQVDKVWTARMSTEAIYELLVHDNANQSIVNEEVVILAGIVNEHLKLFNTKADLELVLKESHHDPRLQRGMNELGLIKPDYGKPFTGLYFEKLTIHLTIQGKKVKQKKQFLERFLFIKLVQYFIEHRTPYSNWEFSWKNRQASNTMNGIQTARSINFPNLEIFIR